ncbi:hypothetical protein [Enterococcus mundtii]|uniref:Uncharacterized protein n=1 Tax=Enterococcus mundtii TaxID=53346 RepID=A0ABQ0VAZ8_ENTMU|nr:hypothetical protein [Enterococcus mundtii]MDB7087397.1 hypothetical protein [Enterococcus mundtii]GEL79648.1 hypothetical protein EMU01_07920 [Enterococcus mundtii]GEN17127.1 hypothetical protein LAC02_04080 [Ligilactobacillus acidipiscis]
MSGIEGKDKINEKKKVQVNINKNLATDVESILDSLGVNPSIVITANNLTTHENANKRNIKYRRNRRIR